MVDHIAGAGVVVAGLPDTADADGVAAIGIQRDWVFTRRVAGDLFSALLPDSRDVGVTVEADWRGLLGKVLLRQALVDDVAEGRWFME